jgi:MFS family permease
VKFSSADWRTLAILSVTQIFSWGSLYYSATILTPEIQNELGWRAETAFGAISWSLLVGGLVSTAVGIFLDRYGGRLVLGTGSFVSAVALLGLSSVNSVLEYYLAWTFLGLGMALTLYEAAFATITALMGSHSRQGISTLTLVAGFASSVFWPLTMHLNSVFGWRKVYVMYGCLQLLICLPLHLLLKKQDHTNPEAKHDQLKMETNYSLQEAVKNPRFWKLALAFAANSFIFSALSIHLIPLFKSLNHSATLAVFAASLIGSMQVLGRLGEMILAKNVQPETLGKSIFLMPVIALFILLVFGSSYPAVLLFCALYGISNGILTIIRGTIPKSMFGSKNYGAISGAMAGPALLSKAAGPIVIATLVQKNADSILIVSTLLAVSILSSVLYFRSLSSKKLTEN